MQHVLTGTTPRYANTLRLDRRTVPTEVRKTWQVSKVWDRHHQIKRLVFLGLTNKEIAERLNCHPQTVSLVRNSTVVKDQLALMHAQADAKSVDIATEIAEFTPIALNLLKQVVEGEGIGKDATIALRAREANNFLDRAGFVKKTKIEAVTAHLTKDEIEEIKQNALKAGRINGHVVEAEVVEENG